MIWQSALDGLPLSQGDVFLECPLALCEYSAQGRQMVERSLQVIVLAQSCDLAQAKSMHVAVAIVHEAQHLVDQGVLKAPMIREQIRAHRVFGWYFLPKGPGLPESLVDLHDVHTVPRRLLEELIADGKRAARLLTPYREHMAQHFATTYARIALPEPYDTEP